MIDETGGRADKAVQPQALNDAVEVAERGLCLGENVECADACGVLALGEIDTGPERGDQVEIRRGLEGGESVVVSAPAGLKDGARVRAKS